MFWTKFTKKDISKLKQNESFPSLGNVSMVENGWYLWHFHTIYDIKGMFILNFMSA